MTLKLVADHERLAIQFRKNEIFIKSDKFKFHEILLLIEEEKKWYLVKNWVSDKLKDRTLELIAANNMQGNQGGGGITY